MILDYIFSYKYLRKKMIVNCLWLSTLMQLT